MALNVLISECWWLVCIGVETMGARGGYSPPNNFLATKVKHACPSYIHILVAKVSPPKVESVPMPLVWGVIHLLNGHILSITVCPEVCTGTSPGHGV